MFPKKLWLYPLIFGAVGGLIGLILRLAFTEFKLPFLFKNILHAHSHVMLLGFLFNGLVLLIWKYFTKGIDKTSIKFYIALQVCLAIMIIAFIYQGYAVYSILFSTLHLWLSYILLVRLWKRLEGNNSQLTLVKTGIIFYFISSIGPYALGPLMVLHMKGTVWYQQAIFFYLHFQFLGVYFIWLLALIFKKADLYVDKKYLYSIIISLILLYTHSLDYSFDHLLIQFLGGFSSAVLFGVLLKYTSRISKLENKLKNIYYLVLSVAFINILGSFPVFSNLVLNNRFVLIAWLHFLFLGLYVPAILTFIDSKINNKIWFIYGVFFLLSEGLLVFYNVISNWISFSINNLLFVIYLGVFLSLLIIHVKIVIHLKLIHKES